MWKPTDDWYKNRQCSHCCQPTVSMLYERNIFIPVQPSHNLSPRLPLAALASVMDAYILFTFDLNKRIIYYFIRARIIDTAFAFIQNSCPHNTLPVSLQLQSAGRSLGTAVFFARRFRISNAFQTVSSRPMGEERNHFESAQGWHPRRNIEILQLHCSQGVPLFVMEKTNTVSKSAIYVSIAGR